MRITALALTSLALTALGAESIGFKIEQARAEAVYALGEEAVFTITATNGAGTAVKAGSVSARLDDYGSHYTNNVAFDLAQANPFTVRGALKEPGFLRLAMTGKDARRTVVGAVFAPEKIRPAGTCPADFDAFWAAARARLAKEVPLDPRLEPMPARSKGPYDFHRVSFATFGGKRVWGFLSVPKDKSKAPFPVNVEVASAGRGPWTATTSGKPDRICLFFTVHNFTPPDPPVQAAIDACHDALEAELKAAYGVGSYCAAGLGKSREEYYFYRQILGIDRAVAWLWARDDVDRARFHYRGGSQGGAFGWCLCGLNPEKFTSAVLYVPAMADTLGDLVGRVTGFPYVLAMHARRPDRDTAYANAPYFNGAFFAARVRCPTRVSVGFIDEICPPTGIYAAYNNLGSADKDIVHGVTRGHGGWAHAELARWQDTTDFTQKKGN